MSPLIRVSRGRKHPKKKTLRTSGASNRYTSNRSFQNDPEFDVDDDDDDDNDELVSAEWTKEK
ncbi:hypothetical protein SAICODRAFT_31850 [Saitoella complicata NRRL Y-17804]|uniref:uncharacterized protein n=1 Tax=Saitoella complicata (strain BCRC 22490 / CBS 7301 / JCM 7358 / NBRC 10748 / NRRL Y-17804) TaxID=698492 RepID=UPI00086792E3|nr:uncharacterized protein SAICODRAFT_31850 [Saitoella complicata NRRL Y-17804]ODQ50561.1 hypothetical protein SAICODRAFT_31850 [Saitoella complicata NRRL Y-17804]